MKSQSVDVDPRTILERYVRAWAEHDLEAKGACYREDAIQEWPQSGERVRGRNNIGAIDQNYPGLPDPQVRRIIGSGNLWVLETILEYGDQTFHACSILEMENGQIKRETGYFAAPFDPPEWRRKWAETTRD